mgnify:CR=1 FL=1
MSLPAADRRRPVRRRARPTPTSRRVRACSARWPLCIARSSRPRRSRSCPRRSASRRRSTTASRQMESFGRTVDDAQYQQMERMARDTRYFARRSSSWSCCRSWRSIVAGIAFAVFNAALGGDATVQAGLRHRRALRRRSWRCSSCSTLPLAYARESAVEHDQPRRCFVPFLDENSFAARLLGSIDLFVIWWMVSLAIGLGVLVSASAPGRSRPPCSSSTRRSG